MKNFIDSLIEEWKAIINNSEENKTFLRKAYQNAIEKSHDKETKTWSVIVKNWEIISNWANQFPEWIEITPDKLERPKK